MFLLYCILFGENWCCGGQAQGRQGCCGNAAPAAEECCCPCTYRICCRKECCCQKQVCGSQKACCGQGNGYGGQGNGYGGYSGLNDGCGCSLNCCSGYGRHGSGGVCCDECYYRRQYALCGRCCE